MYVEAFMSPFEARASIKTGTAVARRLPPLVADRVFRFPIATLAMRDRVGLHSAAEYAMENATAPVTKQQALEWAYSLKAERREV